MKILYAERERNTSQILIDEFSPFFIFVLKTRFYSYRWENQNTRCCIRASERGDFVCEQHFVIILNYIMFFLLWSLLCVRRQNRCHNLALKCKKRNCDAPPVTVAVAIAYASFLFRSFRISHTKTGLDLRIQLRCPLETRC